MENTSTNSHPMEVETDHSAATQLTKLKIHRSNLFTPRTTKIQLIKKSPVGDMLAILRTFATKKETNQDEPISIIEIYSNDKVPTLLNRIVFLENITSFEWIRSTDIVTVSKEQAIKIVNISGSILYDKISDYGSILCCHFVTDANDDKIIVTATEYGYVAMYKLEGNDLEFIQNMKTSSSSPIHAIAIHETTIYGASDNEIIVWDYARRSIIDTIKTGNSEKIGAMLIIDGDLVVGDGSGTLTIIDKTSLTSRLSWRPLQSAILCLAVDSPGKRLLVSGKEHTVMMFKRTDASGEFSMFENVTQRHHPILSLEFGDEYNFYSGGLDGLLIRNTITKSGKKLLLKSIMYPNYTDAIRFSSREMMIQYDDSLVIWTLPRKLPPHNDDGDVVEEEDEIPDSYKPVKSLLLKKKAYIISSTFNQDWIACSTRKGLYVFYRIGKNLIACPVDKSLGGANILEIGDQTLAVIKGTTLVVVKLAAVAPVEGTNGFQKTKSSACLTVVSTSELDSPARHATFMQSGTVLAIVAGFPANRLLVFEIDSTNLNIRRITNRIIPSVRFLARDTPISGTDSSFYTFTNHNEIVGYNSSGEEIREPTEISGLKQESPGDDIRGMIFISSDHCLLYNENTFFKVDLESNEVTNHNSAYSKIIKMDNSAFKDPRKIALAELPDDIYDELLPSAEKLAWKFGR